MLDSVVTRLDAVANRIPLLAVETAALVVLGEFALLVGYVGLTGAEPTAVRYLAYPFVWLNLSLWAVFVVDPPSARPRLRGAVLLAATGYLLVLASAGGVVDLAHVGHSHGHSARGFTVFTSLPPGWGPTVVYDHALFSVTLVPYQVVGYLALTYLVYAALLDAAAAALSGAVGLLSCVSCSWPVFASLLAGLLGGPAVAATVYTLAVDLSTAAFAAAVVLLVWRPGTG
jgi:hypothetical protein